MRTRNHLLLWSIVMTTAAAASPLPPASASAADAARSDLVVTSRPCLPEQTAHPTPGPACLVASQDLGALPDEPVYWHIDTFATEAAANAAKTARGTVVTDYGQVWLFTIEGRSWRARSGTHKATIGPLPVEPAAAFSAEYVHSMFAPGMSAPVHKHSGPEGFYAIDGDTCLEMPGGVHTASGPGNSLVMQGGPPMLLMATGTRPRRAFALVLHDATQPATTRVTDWKPEGRCVAAPPGA